MTETINTVENMEQVAEVAAEAVKAASGKTNALYIGGTVVAVGAIVTGVYFVVKKVKKVIADRKAKNDASDDIPASNPFTEVK